MAAGDMYTVAQAVQDIKDKIQEEYNNMTKLNIVVIGKTGVGKSTLINNVFRDNLARVGIGRPVTQNICKIEKEGTPLTIFDTPGLELGGEHSAEELQEEVLELINDGIKSGDANQAIHCIWYCINTSSSRIEQAELDFLKNIAEKTLRYHVPVILVLTQAFSKKKADRMVEEAKKAAIPVCKIVPVLAEDYEIDEDMDPIKAYGLDKLVEAMNDVLEDSVRDTLVAMQIVNIDIKRSRARAAVVTAAGAAALTGAAPIPGSDAPLLVADQVAMLASITVIFGLPVDKAVLTSVVSAVVGTAGTTVLGKTAVANLIKLIPGAGTIVGGVISGTTAATLTGALGEAYIAIMTKVVSGDMAFADLAGSEGVEALKREFKKQLQMR